jgi:vacuolar protein sorting-associated protein VTA1
MIGNYFIINQILNKGLHTESDECMTYTTTLMDRLETFKNENLGNDTVHDDVAAQAFVEQFALDTFNRADTAIRTNKATAQTAQIFQAAATFLDLLGIWQTPLNPEIATKSKYAKFHALRIAKALRNGENPNDSNPEQEPAPEAPPLSADDPEVQRITGLQPSVEDVSDTSRPPSFIDRPPSTAGSPSMQTGIPPQAPSQHDVSPLEASPPPQEYFPNIPTFTSETSAPSLPTAPESNNVPDITMTSAHSNTAPALSPPPQNFYNVQTPPINTPRAPSHPQMPQLPFSHGASPSHFAPTPTAPQAFIPTPHSEPQPLPVQPSIPLQQPQPTHIARPMQGYNKDDEAVLAAQKHARWAISALNFEDVDTAVSELRIALQALGAS